MTNQVLFNDHKADLVSVLFHTGFLFSWEQSSCLNINDSNGFNAKAITSLMYMQGPLVRNEINDYIGMDERMDGAKTVLENEDIVIIFFN